MHICVSAVGTKTELYFFVALRCRWVRADGRENLFFVCVVHGFLHSNKRVSFGLLMNLFIFGATTEKMFFVEWVAFPHRGWQLVLVHVRALKPWEWRSWLTVLDWILWGLWRPHCSCFCESLSLAGGLSSFKQNHESLCDHSLQLQECPEGGGDATAVTPTLPQSVPTTPDIENAELTRILPFLFLGNEQDAQDLEKMQRVNIGYVINVTAHLPLYHYEKGQFSYKRLPATDSNKQNLRQYFEEAFEFIGNYPFLLCFFFPS